MKHKAKPPPRDKHASELPKLTGLWRMTPELNVVAVDANMLVNLARHLVKNGSLPALLELANAGYIRIVISADDVALVPQSQKTDDDMCPRVVRSMRRAYPKYADELQQVWETELRPLLHVIDPSPLVDTPRSAAVRARDADDAMLARVAELVGADYFFSSDKEAFGNGEWPMVGTGGHVKDQEAWAGIGEVSAAMRNNRRVEESTQLFLAPIPLTGLAVQEASKSLGKALGVPPVLVGLGLVGLSGLAAWAMPSLRDPLWRGAKDYGRFIMQIQMTPEEYSYNAALLEPYHMKWEAPTEIITWAARKLAHARHGATTTELAKGTKLSVAEWRVWLTKYPGIFYEVSRGRWVLVE